MDTAALQLDDILITAELERRPPECLDEEMERTGLTRIARSMDYGRDAVFAAICELALAGCKADSAGISVLCDPPEEGFTWDALVGRFSPYLNGTAPRHDSPCGVSLDTGRTQLFSHPERLFAWMRGPDIPIVEGLVIPLYKSNRVPYGSLWVMTHEPGRSFCGNHAALMSKLAGHVSAALQIQSQRLS